MAIRKDIELKQFTGKKRLCEVCTRPINHRDHGKRCFTCSDEIDKARRALHSLMFQDKKNILSKKERKEYDKEFLLVKEQMIEMVKKKLRADYLRQLKKIREEERIDG